MSRKRHHAFKAMRCCTYTVITLVGLLFLPSFAAATPCTVPDAGGTVVLPPAGCGYLSPSDVHVIINGLPPGTTIQVGVEHQEFFNITHMPGGSLGGEVENFQSFLHLTLTGTGSLSGYSRVLNMQAQCQTETGPRAPGTNPQSFDTQMTGLQGQLPAGDPDFDLLRITAGNAFGMPSPGHTTLTKLPSGNWNVDSFFDITYRIDFVGHPGGPLSGRSGSTTGTIRMGTGEPPPSVPPCTVADDGTGTVDLPPAGCGYVSPSDLHMMIDGLPPGTTVNIGVQHRDFFGSHSRPGGSLGGMVEDFGSVLVMHLKGTGEMSSYQRDLTMQAQCQTETGPRAPGGRQSFDNGMNNLQGQITGDPDFDLLRITAGSGFGMPSPGHTTLTSLPGPGLGTLAGDWNVYSFFDITYRIDFVGAPGGPFSGRSGSTTGTIRMQTGVPTTNSVPGLQIGSLKLTNRPNPFGQLRGTTVEYRLPAPAHVSLAVFDPTGRRVRELSSGMQPEGPHAQMWDGRNDAGRRLGPGTYLIKIAVNGKSLGTTKTTMVR